jgi:adenosylcobinamide-GDP ribazoletransferase
MGGGWRAAVAFLTPLGGAAAPTAAALPWFGVVGAGVGAAVAVTLGVAAGAVPALVAAALAVTVDAGLTGMLHLDGLADCADGLLPPMAPARRLEVLRDPRAGAFAVVAVGLVLILRVAALSGVVLLSQAAAGGSFGLDAGALWAIVALWALSRAAMALIAVTVPYARQSGLATAFLGARPGPVLIAGAVPVALAAILAVATTGSLLPLVALAGAAATAAGTVAFAHRRVGGFTGDVLGAAGVLAETVGLVLLTVRR